MKQAAFGPREEVEVTCSENEGRCCRCRRADEGSQSIKYSNFDGSDPGMLDIQVTANEKGTAALRVSLALATRFENTNTHATGVLPSNKTTSDGRQ